MCDRIGTGRLSDDQLNPRVNAISTPTTAPFSTLRPNASIVDRPVVQKTTAYVQIMSEL